MSKKSFYCIGSFGGPNLGDDLLCLEVVNRLRQTYPGSGIYLTTGSGEVSRRYAGVDAEYVEGDWPSPEYFRHFRRHIEAMAKSRILVIGGGGLIADYYSWGTIPRCCVDVLWAILMGRRYVFVGLGVRRIRRRWLRPLARFVCRRAAAVYCRDKESAGWLKQLTRRDDILVGPDLANMARMEFSEQWEEKNYALVNFRQRPPIDENKLTELCRELLKGTGELVLLSAERADTDYYKRIVGRWSPQERAATRIVEPSNLHEAVRWIQEARVVVAERFHVNLLAAQAGRRLLTINYEGKVEQFIGTLGGKPLICSLEELGAEQARKLLSAEAPQWSEMFCEMEEQAKEIFDETIRAGLPSGSYGFWERFVAAVYLMVLLAFGFLWSVAVLVKRAIFGRGPLPWSRWYLCKVGRAASGS